MCFSVQESAIRGAVSFSLICNIRNKIRYLQESVQESAEVGKGKECRSEAICRLATRFFHGFLS
jgi:hypothetical protein